MTKSHIPHPTSHINHQRGATAILLAVLILSMLLIIGLGVSTLIISQIKMSAQTGQSVQAFYAAEAGAERCLYQVRRGVGACASVGGSISATLDNGATYQAGRVNASSITSVGQFGQTSRKVELNW